MFEFYTELFNNPHKEVKTSRIYIDKKKRIFHPEGLFSEQIFGPVKDYECQCGHLRGKENAGKRCPHCNVLCDSSLLRYTEFGYIKLKVPILLPPIANKIIKKFFKSSDEYDLLTTLVTHTTDFLVFDKVKKKFVKPSFTTAGNIIPKDFDASTCVFKYKNFSNIIVLHSEFSNDDVRYDIKELRQRYLIDYPVFGLYSLYKLWTSDVFKPYIDEFLNKNPHWKQFINLVFIDKLPVLPPEIRPHIETENKTIIHRLTRVLQMIIDINNRDYFAFNNTDLNDEDETIADVVLKDQIALRLQKRVNEYYEMILNELSGKEGKIRQYIHGKTIDFSSRGVVVPSLNVKPYEIEIPYHTAKEVFSPYFAAYLVDKLLSDNQYNNLALKFLALQHGAISQQQLTKEEKELIDKYFDEFIDKINTKEIKFYGILNRAPTLWIYNFLVFDIKVKKDKNDYTIGVHPLALEQQNMDQLSRSM